MGFEKNGLMQDIIRKNYNKLTKSGKKLADYILMNPEDAAFLSSAKLGRKVNVSESTVIRFSTEIGCSGFPELQGILQDHLKEKIKPSERLRKFKRSRKKGETDHEQVFKSAMENLKGTLDGIRPEVISSVVEKIISARKIYVVGFRRAFSIAYLLNFDLGRLLKNTILIESSYGLVFDRAIEMSRKDVCIGISFPRYSTMTYKIMELARKHGSTTISITDSFVSPIAQISDYVLTTENKTEYSFPESRIAALTLIDCIVAEVARKQRRSIKTLQDLETSLKDYDTWLIED